VNRRAGLVNQLAAADALIVGAPSYFGGMAAALKRFFEDTATAAFPPDGDRSWPWRHHLFRDKAGAAFTASGTPHGGNEQTLHSILTMMMHLGMVLITPGQQAPFPSSGDAPYGVTAITGTDDSHAPGPDQEAAARALGRRVALIATRLRQGRASWE
jgi:NAD(P)H dehydrogenase (quinone)